MKMESLIQTSNPRKNNFTSKSLSLIRPWNTLRKRKLLNPLWVRALGHLPSNYSISLKTPEARVSIENLKAHLEDYLQLTLLIQIFRITKLIKCLIMSICRQWIKLLLSRANKVWLRKSWQSNTSPKIAKTPNY